MTGESFSLLFILPKFHSKSHVDQQSHDEVDRNLAEQEVLINAGERASIDIYKTKEEVLSVETNSFVLDLFSHFETLIELFNSRVNHPSLQIKLVRHPEPSVGFSMTRNRMKLTLSSPQPGAIQFSCEKQIVDDLRGLKSTVMFSGLIEAEFGTFHDVEWYFLGSRIGAEQVARHYLTEFIQVSQLTTEII